MSQPTPPQSLEAEPAPDCSRVVPRDAATLVLCRRDQGEPQILVGKRAGGLKFMPNLYVFPGGRVDPADARAARASDLRPEVLAKLALGTTPARAHALAMAAVREMFEEAGLLVGQRATRRLRSRSESWGRFFAAGVVPALHGLDYIARAITPPGNPRRFDTRFFLADASHAHAPDDLTSSGELLDLRWVALGRIRELPLPEATLMVIAEVEKRVAAPDPSRVPIPFARYVRDGVKLEHI
jgi:8-oxo-dGTP pyrophosphatase MutT (NUDIX family)